MPGGEGLGDEEAAAEIGFEDCVPVVPGDLEGGLADVHAGVVDEDVYFGVEVVSGRGEGGDALLVADVKREGLSGDAGGGELGEEGVAICGAAAGEDEGGAGTAEGRARSTGRGRVRRRLTTAMWPVRSKRFSGMGSCRGGEDDFD